MELRRTWLAGAVIVGLAGPMIGGGTRTAGPDLLYGITAVLLTILTMLRVGLLATISALMCERLLARLPLTLDVTAWYVESSLLVVILVLAAAVYGFVLALPSRRSPGLEPALRTAHST